MVKGIQGLLIGTCLMAWGGAAFGQDATAEAASSPEHGGLTEIIVTARKRSESAQSIPVAVTAISAETINRRDLTSIEKIAAATPNLNVAHAPTGPGAQITLRGIGSSSTSIGIEQSVATVVDGVYYGQGRIIEEGFFDLQGVEVLKGPQVLFVGKNATAGVISIKTADPTPDWETMVRGSYEFNARQAQLEGVISGPVSDTLGVRIALRGTKAWGGLYDNVSTPYFHPLTGQTSQPTSSNQPGNRDLIGRLTLQFKPDSDITNTFKASFTRSDLNNSSFNSVPYFCPTGKTQLAGYDCGFNFVTHVNNIPAAQAANYPFAGDGGLYNKYRSAQATNTFEWRMGDVTFTNVTNYNWNNNKWICACDFQSNPFAIWVTENSSWKAFSNEARFLTSFDSPINLMAGVLYQSTKREFEQYVSFSLSNIPAAGRLQYVDAYKVSSTKGETISPFAQVTWKVTDTLQIDGGLRYTHETKDSAFVQPYVSPAFAPVWIVNRTTRGDQTFNNWSPEVSMTYKPVSGMMIYAAFKTGYKSGGFSNGGIDSAFGNPASDLVFGPETVSGFEGGIKSTLLDNQLRLNLGVYTYGYRNFQLDFLNSLIIAFQTLNADARTKGAEFEFEYAPRAIDGLNIHGSLNYNDAKYTNFPDAPCYVGQTPGMGCNLVPNAGGGFTRLTAAQIAAGAPAGSRQDLKGVKLGVAPTWTGALGVAYDSAVGGGLRAGISVDTRFSSSYLASGFGAGHSRNPSYGILDIALRLGAEDDNWQFAVIGKNLTNKQYFNGAVDGVNTGSGTGTNAGRLADQFGLGAMPRTVMAQMTKRF